MFKCEKCGLDSEPGETQVKIVIATRKKEYPAFQRVNGTHDRGGTGREIAQEVVVHERCTAEVHAMIAAADAATAEAIARASAAAESPVVYTSDLTHDSTPFNSAHVA